MGGFQDIPTIPHACIPACIGGWRVVGVVLETRHMRVRVYVCEICVCE